METNQYTSSASKVFYRSKKISIAMCDPFKKSAHLRVEEDKNIADLSLYDKYKQISSCITL